MPLSQLKFAFSCAIMLEKSKEVTVMALIICPDCKNQISDRAERCPYCGLPAQYFHGEKSAQSASAANNGNLDYSNLGNILLSFDKDYCALFGASHYITHREEDHMNEVYREYYKTL